MSLSNRNGQSAETVNKILQQEPNAPSNPSVVAPTAAPASVQGGSGSYFSGTLQKMVDIRPTLMNSNGSLNGVATPIGNGFTQVAPQGFPAHTSYQNFNPMNQVNKQMIPNQVHNNLMMNRFDLNQMNTTPNFPSVQAINLQSDNQFHPMYGQNIMMPQVRSNQFPPNLIMPQQVHQINTLGGGFGHKPVDPFQQNFNQNMLQNNPNNMMLMPHMLNTPLDNQPRFNNLLQRNMQIPNFNDPYSLNMNQMQYQQNQAFNHNQLQINGNIVEKVRTVHHQLMLILHSNSCEKNLKESESRGIPYSCFHTYCKEMKHTLDHVNTCVSKGCQIQHCQSTKDLINHWNTCQNPKCVYCAPLRFKLNEDQKALQNNSQNQLQIINMNQYHNNITINKNPIFNNQVSINPNGPTNFQQNSSAGNMAVVNSVQNKNNANFVPNDLTPANIQLYTSPKSAAPSLSEIKNESNSNAESSSLISISKPWQNSITEDKREMLRTKFVAAITPFTDLSIVNEECKMRLKQYSIQTEQEAFNKATSIDDYKNIMSCKIKSVINEYREQNTKAENEALLTESLNPDSIRKRQSDNENHLEEINLKKAKNDNDSPSFIEYLNTKPAISMQDIIESQLRPMYQKIEAFMNELKLAIVPVGINKSCIDLFNEVRKKLDECSYQTPFEFNCHIHEMIQLILTNSKTGTRVSKNVSRLVNYHSEIADDVMKDLGYCCGQVYRFKPQEISCLGKQLCYIRINQSYMAVDDKYPYCEECFNSIKSKFIDVVEDIAKPAMPIEKSNFKKYTNDKFISEPITKCIHCNLEFHSVCVLYSKWKYPNGFICSKCIKAKQNPDNFIVQNKFSARSLPSSQLGNFIENKINCFLEEKDYRNILLSTKQASKVGRILVRVVYDQQKTFKTLNNLRSFKGSTTNNSLETFDESLPDFELEYKYRVKNIFCFQEIDGAEACFFAMLVHEYGSDCPENNRNRIHISYMDSVKIFQPAVLRTDLYHQILISYLNYSKIRGYQYAHIWACPPGENDDYIFYRHPPQQNIPKVKMLCSWYNTMLEKAKKFGIIEDSSDIASYVKKHQLSDIKSLPYLEGDFWPNMIEESIHQINSISFPIQSSDESSLKTSDFSKTSSKKKKTGKPKKGGYSKKPEDDKKCLFDRIAGLLDKYKDIFFVVTLSSNQSKLVDDTDKLLNCDLMEARDNFLTFARENNYEFSSLRRVMNSTQFFVAELINQYQDSFSCNECHSTITVSYYNCKICEDYDICSDCYSSKGHIHNLELISFESSYSDYSQTLSAKLKSKALDSKDNKSKVQKIKLGPKELDNYNKVLVHVVACLESNCKYGNCDKFRKKIQHYKACQQKLQKNNECLLCKFLNALFIHHSKSCEISNKSCRVPRCALISERLAEKQKLKLAKEAAFLNSRISAVMQIQEEEITNEMPQADNNVQQIYAPAVSTAGLISNNENKPNLSYEADRQKELKPGKSFLIKDFLGANSPDDGALTPCEKSLDEIVADLK